jgi:hypothetical protein
MVLARTQQQQRAVLPQEVRQKVRVPRLRCPAAFRRMEPVRARPLERAQAAPRCAPKPAAEAPRLPYRPAKLPRYTRTAHDRRPENWRHYFGFQASLPAPGAEAALRDQAS